jgi:uncharacterized protein VirK/YbjX
MREKNLWPLIAGFLWRGITNIDSWFNVHRLTRLQDFAEVIQSDPKFPFKFLFRHYLARGFTVAERASCFLHHYQRLRAMLPASLLKQVLDKQIILHEFPDCGNRIALSMGLSRPFTKEGELSLNLLVDGEIVFVLSFTIVPGCVVESELATALLVTRIQGRKGCYSQISFATKTLHDVAPCALLFAALQGVAYAFEIGEIAFICAARQTYFSAEDADAFQSTYDDFFAELGLAKNASGFFLNPLPIEDKPLVDIKRGHKIRTKKKRAFKRQVEHDVTQLLRERLAFESPGISRVGPAVHLYP